MNKIKRRLGDIFSTLPQQMNNAWTVSKSSSNKVVKLQMNTIIQTASNMKWSLQFSCLPNKCSQSSFASLQGSHYLQSEDGISQMTGKYFSTHKHIHTQREQGPTKVSQSTRASKLGWYSTYSLSQIIAVAVQFNGLVWRPFTDNQCTFSKVNFPFKIVYDQSGFEVRAFFSIFQSEFIM